MKHTASGIMVIILLMINVSMLHAQDEVFIYGKVSTVDDKQYEGPIRWGKEEIYWVDLFNAGKPSNENLRYLSAQDREELDDRNRLLNWSGGDWGNNWKRWFGNWDGKPGTRDYTHQFGCQFGEIKSITPDGRNDVTIEMQNGAIYELEGEGYNDVGLDIHIMDPELGEVDVAWGRIRKVEFMNTPKNLLNRFGKPLYGTVEAFGDKFTGYIQWDHDERLNTDKLDGDTEDGDVSIEFGKILSIEKKSGGSQVVLKSGRSLRMDDSNDVDSGNRGIIIMNKDMVEIDVPWDEFDRITFTDAPADPPFSYSGFLQQKQLGGTVETVNGEKLTGRIVYDLDESYSYELLQGKSGEFEFVTPFKNIKSMEPLSERRCQLILASGRKIVLDDAQDVNENNQGILVFSSKEPRYVRWDQVKSIHFK